MLPESYAIHANIVERLFTENEPRDVAFLQIASPGKKFEVYNKEKFKMPIPLKAYVELLNFFATDYERVKSKIDADGHVMSVGKEWLSLKPSMSFLGPADITFRKTLANHANYTLELFIVRRHEVGKISTTLRYSVEDMGMMYIHPPGMLYLSHDREDVTALQHYKGEPIAKKSRQS
jgi:hypothetical protein